MLLFSQAVHDGWQADVLLAALKSQEGRMQPVPLI